MSGFEGTVSLRPPVSLGTARRSSLGDIAGASLDETLETNPTASILRRQDLELAYGRRDQLLDADTARARLKAAGLEQHLNIPDQGIPEPALDILMKRKREELQRADVLARGGGAVATSTRLAVALAGSLLDPLNIATAFVPVIGPERYAAILARAGGIAGRTAVRAGVGAAEGVVGAALVEPFVASSKALEQADYDMSDSLLNIGFGGVFGAGLHSIGGAVGDVWRYSPQSAGAKVGRAAAETRAQALKASIAQAASGERVNVDPLVRLDEPDPFAAPVAGAERLADAYHREQLSAMRAETGWLEEGGRLITRAAYEGDPNPEVVGRTPWVPRAEWWSERPAGMNEREVQTAIDKALAGETLGPRQQELVDYLLDIADARRKTEPFAATADELAAVGVSDSIDARMEAGIVARASEVDELAVERLAVQHENDPDAFLKAVKEIADRAPAREGLAPRARPPADQAARLDAVRQSAAEPKFSTVADERAAEQGDTFIAENSQADDPLAAVNEETADIMAALKEAGGEDFDAGVLAEYDELMADAKAYGAAARAAVLCGFDHVA